MKLRIQEDVQVPEAVRKCISDLLKEYEEEKYTRQRDLTTSFKTRAKSLLDAFCFAVDAYPPDLPWSQGQGEALKALVLQKFNEIDWGKEAASKYLDEQLQTFTHFIVNVLAQNWTWSASDKQKQAADFLNEAEQYCLMPKGREAKATLVPIKTNDKQIFALLIDKPREAWLPERLMELQKVRDNNCPKTPDWYHNLSEATQIYLTHINRDVVKIDTLHAELFNFIKQYRLHCCSTTIKDELEQIKNQTGRYPQWYQGTSFEIKALIRRLVDMSDTEQLSTLEKVRDELITIKNAKSEVDDINKDIKLVASLPRWYWALPVHHQAFLRHIFKDTRPTAELVSFLSSRLRELPAQANFREHQLVMIDGVGSVIEETPVRLAAANPASRRLLKRPLNEQWAHVDDNLKHILSAASSQKPVLIATNVTPLYGIGLPDPFLSELLAKAIAKIPKSQSVFYFNNSLNIGRAICYTPSSDPNWLALIEAAKAFNDNNLAALIKEAVDTLNAGPGRSTIWDDNRRELYLSSLAHLLIMQMNGLSFGCCISGKDRKAIELIHTDAMFIYKALYGCWPSYYDGVAVGFEYRVSEESTAKRAKFVDIVAELYISRHQQELAGDNAPGCDALKTPDTYFPADIADAIKVKLNREDTHKVEECIAKNNDVDKILKDIGFEKYFWPALPLEQRLDGCNKDTAQSFLDALAALLNETPLFSSSFKSGLFPSVLPSGVKDISNLLREAPKDKSNHYPEPCQLLIDICKLITTRPAAGSNRKKTTNEIYMMLVWLSTDTISSCTERLKAIRNEAYEQNRLITRSTSMPALSSLLNFNGF